MSPPAAAGLPAPLRCAPPPIREEETAQQRWARPREIPSMTDRSRSQSERAVRVIMRKGGTAGCNGGRWGVRVVWAACAARHRSWGLRGVLGPGLPPSERVLCERRGRPEALGPSAVLQRDKMASCCLPEGWCRPLLRAGEELGKGLCRRAGPSPQREAHPVLPQPGQGEFPTESNYRGVITALRLQQRLPAAPSPCCCFVCRLLANSNISRRSRNQEPQGTPLGFSSSLGLAKSPPGSLSWFCREGGVRYSINKGAAVSRRPPSGGACCAPGVAFTWSCFPAVPILAS